MPVIYPAPGDGPALARLLISLADDPHEVGVTNEGGLGFVVSAELEQRWLDATAPAAAPVIEPPRAPKKGAKNKAVGPDVELPEE